MSFDATSFSTLPVSASFLAITFVCSEVFALNFAQFPNLSIGKMCDWVTQRLLLVSFSVGSKPTPDPYLSAMFA